MIIEVIPAKNPSTVNVTLTSSIGQASHFIKFRRHDCILVARRCTKSFLCHYPSGGKRCCIVPSCCSPLATSQGRVNVVLPCPCIYLEALDLVLPCKLHRRRLCKLRQNDFLLCSSPLWCAGQRDHPNLAIIPEAFISIPQNDPIGHLTQDQSDGCELVSLRNSVSEQSSFCTQLKSRHTAEPEAPRPFGSWISPQPVGHSVHCGDGPKF